MYTMAVHGIVGSMAVHGIVITMAGHVILGHALVYFGGAWLFN